MKTNIIEKTVEAMVLGTVVTVVNTRCFINKVKELTHKNYIEITSEMELKKYDFTALD